MDFNVSNNKNKKKQFNYTKVKIIKWANVIAIFFSIWILVQNGSIVFIFFPIATVLGSRHYTRKYMKRRIKR